MGFLASLERHSGAVNVARFSPDGSMLATAGDDGGILLWKRLSLPQPMTPEGSSEKGHEGMEKKMDERREMGEREEGEEEEETWKMIASLM